MSVMRGIVRGGGRSCTRQRAPLADEIRNLHDLVEREDRHAIRRCFHCVPQHLSLEVRKTVLHAHRRLRNATSHGEGVAVDETNAGYPLARLHSRARERCPTRFFFAPLSPRHIPQTHLSMKCVCEDGLHDREKRRRLLAVEKVLFAEEQVVEAEIDENRASRVVLVVADFHRFGQ
jgi:hypothetical protein